MDCLSENAVLELVEGRTAPAVADEVHAHLASCTSCRKVVAEVAASLESAGSDDAATMTMSNPVAIERPDRQPVGAPPERLGRYEVVKVLGMGGMGVVYEAHDPHLGRRVALKVMRADHTLTDEAQARLLREARAMAQIAHPNVVTVHDVGVVGGQIFVAMEYVDGVTLKHVMRERRPWREVVPLFLQAGEGLAAAHAVGLVHRDFKPDNVLVGKDGRVRVTDFGLARLGGPASEVSPHSPAVDLLTTVTRTDLFVGTPAYMSPEQFRGSASDARSDQFSFCVAVYEAVYGERPFAGKGLSGLAASVIVGQVRRPVDGVKVPKAFREALLRGLATDPEKRYSSMPAVLVALRQSVEPPRASRWGFVFALAMVAVGAVGIGVWSRTMSRPVAGGAVVMPGTAAAMESAPIAGPATLDTVIEIAPAAPTAPAPSSAHPSRAPRSKIAASTPTKTPRSPLKPFDEP